MAWVLPNLHWEWRSRSDLADEEGGSSTSKMPLSSPRRFSANPKGTSLSHGGFPRASGEHAKRLPMSRVSLLYPTQKMKKERYENREVSINRYTYDWIFRIFRTWVTYGWAGHWSSSRPRQEFTRRANVITCVGSPMWMCYSSLGVSDKSMFVYETLLYE